MKKLIDEGFVGQWKQVFGLRIRNGTHPCSFTTAQDHRLYAA